MTRDPRARFTPGNWPLGRGCQADGGRPTARVQTTLTCVVWCAVTVTGKDCGQGPETWYRPGGSCTEKIPEFGTRTVTRGCPAVVKATVPGIGRWPGGWPPRLNNWPVT